MSASENGTSHPPQPNPPLGSSSAPPGPCMTPSSVRNVCVTSFTGSSPRLSGSGAEDGVLAPVPELPRRPDLEHTVTGRQPPVRVTARCCQPNRQVVLGTGPIAGVDMGPIVSCGRNGGSVGAVDLEMEFRDGVSLRRQLEDALRVAIRSGRLPPGSALPPSRDLAEQLSVSRGVVVDSYAQLTTEGYLSARRGSGTRVAATAASGRPPARRQLPVPNA